MSFKSAVNSATGNRALQRVARAGYLISGALHLLVASIIMRIAFGLKGEADQTGALATLASRPGGTATLYVVTAGLVALAMWRLCESVLGLHPAEHPDAHKRKSPIAHRLKAFGLALIYGAVALTAIQFALGAQARGSRQTAGVSARLMQSGGGKAVLVIVGFVIVGIGGYYAHKGASRRFLNDLNTDGGRAADRARYRRPCRGGPGAVGGGHLRHRGDVSRRSGQGERVGRRGQGAGLDALSAGRY